MDWKHFLILNYSQHPSSVILDMIWIKSTFGCQDTENDME
ncbi:hypothetical protein wVul_0615 [Wolbachia endosymbiont of Armadillidium vulgare str. wVulC]|nr:hypothetical protein wVul_1384 [Wolbachia endosymbiont of Armadillidium vulgare str. wVulC]KLT21736.1 hypothetical protein wVul_1481 [Wolbachia endosymbiont of Armadillidium vulgare str. wVulC]KLT22254.1 hypothetical protein wVul_1188 [Wolbachia endosymbiont of Armadillidium vulgare str. wVulC]KLT22435.1 hypothetical protein wVul_0800 [Wolbachia endosymbiont of Armadillidium vulgare str. wVulC]KLT22647.1 hypothetical protein wVul_1012 [Wolbachia endosymbiont of Armadillidium vulgare str. wVu